MKMRYLVRKKQLLISAAFLGLLVSCLFWWSPSCPAATYYVRTDGGTATQCTGQSDAPYSGSGTNQACAWSHPFWALDGAGIWKIQGGDTLLIHPGSYRMGFGAPNTDWCDAEGAFDCHLPALPSGPAAVVALLQQQLTVLLSLLTHELFLFPHSNQYGA
jgi:hypothetical protein